MNGVPIPPRRVFGVAIDVGEEAGRATWVCRATPGSDGIRVESVDPLADLPGGVAQRDDAMRFLLGKMVEARRSAWGVDAPLGVAASIPVQGAPAHEPAPWHAAWRRALGTPATDGLAPRQTERELGVAPAELARRELLTSQLLIPAADRTEIAVLPFQPLPVLPAGTPPAMAARAPSIYLLECRPEATVVSLARVLDDDGERIDDSLRSSPEGRVVLLRALVRAGWVRPMARRLRTRITDAESSRALDAVLIAVGAWRGYRERDHGALCRDPRYGLEGLIYC